MVEILLSLVFLVAAGALALWPWVGIHDHTIDGLFLTLTGSIMVLLFLFNFIWQLRSQGAEEKIRIRNAWQQLAHSIAASSRTEEKYDNHSAPGKHRGCVRDRAVADPCISRQFACQRSFDPARE